MRVWQPNTGIAKMPSTDAIPSVTANQLTRVLGEAVIRLPQAVQNRLFQEAVTSHGEFIRLPLAVFLHDKHPRTSLGNPALVAIQVSACLPAFADSDGPRHGTRRKCE
jgi:hypothetical protein